MFPTFPKKIFPNNATILHLTSKLKTDANLTGKRGNPPICSGESSNCLRCGSRAVRRNPMEDEAQRMEKVARATWGMHKASRMPREERGGPSSSRV